MTLNLNYRAVVSSRYRLPTVILNCFSYDDLPFRGTHGVVLDYVPKEHEDNVWLILDPGLRAWRMLVISSSKAISRSIAAVNSALLWRDRTPGAAGVVHLTTPEILKKLIDTALGMSWADIEIVELGKNEEHFLSLEDHKKINMLCRSRAHRTRAG